MAGQWPLSYWIYSSNIKTYLHYSARIIELVSRGRRTFVFTCKVNTMVAAPLVPRSARSPEAWHWARLPGIVQFRYQKDKHIETDTKWPPFCRRYFQAHIPVWTFLYFDCDFIEICPIDYNPALVQIIVWRLPGAKLLSEPMMVILLTHMCVTRPQWFNTPAYQNAW